MPKRKVFKKIIFLFFYLSFLFSQNLPLAEGNGATTPGGVTTPVGTPLPNPLGTDSIMKVINNIIDYLILYSIPILAIMILWGGFQILMARDDPEKIKNGRSTIQWAVIGFAIILISKGIGLIILRLLTP